MTDMTLNNAIVEKWMANPMKYDLQRNDLKALIAHYSTIFHSFGIEDNAKEAFIAYVLNSKLTEPPDEILLLQLNLLRIIFRDKKSRDLDCFEPMARRLFVITQLDDEDINQRDFNEEHLMEAEKVLSNFVFNSAKARQAFEKHAASRILARIRYICASSDASSEQFVYLSGFSADALRELHFFDLKIAFIVSAQMHSIQEDWLNDTDKTIIFVDVLRKAIDDLDSTNANSHRDIAIQALNVLYNLYCHAQIFDLEVASACGLECARVVGSARCDFELKQQAVNVLALLPIVSDVLCPKQTDKTVELESVELFEGCDVKYAKDLFALFEEAIEKVKDESHYLAMFFKAMIGLCTNNKAARRYCRLKILPPLTAREVEKPPEQGDTLRNKIIRLMHGTSQVAQLASEFLYVLCKRSESRMMKYCGFGHSAGLFANRGLLGAAAVAKRSESDSEDSETEDYREVEDKVNPITGYIPSQEHLEEIRRNLASMTDEQKEHEAMKLANAMSKLMDEGVFGPAVIGEDGRPRQVSHVAELVKDVKTPEHNSDDESD